MSSESSDNFIKLDMSVAKVLEVSIVPGTKKLIKVKVDVRGEVRQTIAALGQHYEPEGLAGMEAIVVTNLQPGKIHGIESEIMLMAVVDGDNANLIQTDKTSIPEARVA